METLTPAMLVALGEKGVKMLDDLADLASDELIEIVGTDNMDEATANEVIMAARAHWFEGEEAGASRRPGDRQEASTAEAEEAGEAVEPETGPLRRCILTRDRLPKEQMIRFVVGPKRASCPIWSQGCPDGEFG